MKSFVDCIPGIIGGIMIFASFFAIAYVASL